MIKYVSSSFIVFGLLYIPLASVTSLLVGGKYNIISSFIGVLFLFLGFLMQRQNMKPQKNDILLITIIILNLIYLALNSIFNIISSSSINYLFINFTFLLHIPFGFIVFKNIKNKESVLKVLFFFLLYYVIILTILSFKALHKHGFNLEQFRYILSLEFQDNGLYINFLALRNFIITTLFLLVYHTTSSKVKKNTVILVLVYLTLFSFFSGSRQALLGIMGITFIYFLIIKRYNKRSVVRWIVVLFFGLLFMPKEIFNIGIIEDVFYNRFFLDNNFFLETDVDRVNLLNSGFEIFLSNPVFGVGESLNYLLSRDPHNTYIQILAEKGIIGLILFLLIFVFFFRLKGSDRQLYWLKNSFILFIIIIYLFTNTILSSYDLFMTLTFVSVLCNSNINFNYETKNSNFK